MRSWVGKLAGVAAAVAVAVYCGGCDSDPETLPADVGVAGDSAADGAAPDGSAPGGADSSADASDGEGPDGTGPDGTGPDGTGPDGTGPDGTGPDGTGPDGTDPDSTDPDSTDPDSTDPDSTGPDGTGPDTSATDVMGPDGTDPDGAAPDATICANDGDCDDADACTIDTCENDGSCSHSPAPLPCAPCTGNADCIDDDVCSAEVCVLGACDTEPSAYQSPLISESSLLCQTAGAAGELVDCVIRVANDAERGIAALSLVVQFDPNQLSYVTFVDLAQGAGGATVEAKVPPALLWPSGHGAAVAVSEDASRVGLQLLNLGNPVASLVPGSAEDEVIRVRLKRLVDIDLQAPASVALRSVTAVDTALFTTCVTLDGNTIHLADSESCSGADACDGCSSYSDPGGASLPMHTADANGDGIRNIADVSCYLAAGAAALVGAALPSCMALSAAESDTNCDGSLTIRDAVRAVEIVLFVLTGDIDLYAALTSEDFDGDYLHDCCDPDDDNDGTPDTEDPTPKGNP